MPTLKNRKPAVADEVIQQYVRNSQGVDANGLPTRNYVDQGLQDAEDYANGMTDDDYSQIQDYADNAQDYSTPTDQSAGVNKDLQQAEHRQSDSNTSVQNNQSDNSGSRAQRQTSKQENAVNYRGGNTRGKSKGGIKGAIGRKIGMWILGISATAIIGLGIGGASSASLLLQSIVQRIDNSPLNVGDWASDFHSRKIYKHTLKAMKGCQSSIFKACDRFKDMSERQQKKFKQNGWKMYDADGNEITDIKGKKEVRSLQPPDDIELPTKVGDKDISNRRLDADTLVNAMDKSPSLRKSMSGVYNPRFGSFSDSAFMKFLSRFKLKKRSSVDGSTTKEMDDQMRKTVDEDTNEDDESSSGGTAKECTDPAKKGKFCVDGDGAEIEDAKSLDDAQKKIDGGNETFDAKAKNNPKDDLDATTDRITGTGIKNKLSNWFSSGNVQTWYCSLYNGARGVSTAIKIFKSRKLLTFALQFLTTASAIMAGKATAEQVQYLGDTLTQVTKDDNTNEIISGSGMDSANMKFALYQQESALTVSSMSYKASLTGNDPVGIFALGMASVAGIIFPGFSGVKGANYSCNAWMSSAMQTGLLITGIASDAWSFVAGAGIGTVVKKAIESGVYKAVRETVEAVIEKAVSKNFAKLAWNKIKDSKSLLMGAALDIGGGMAFDKIAEIIPTMITNAMVGGITDGLKGEKAGDALSAGYDEMFSKSFKNRGGAPLHTNEAVAYKAKMEQRALAYAEEQRVGAKWYDIYNSYTALGSVTSELAINMSGALSSPSMFIKRVAGVVSRGYASIKNPLTAKAEDTASYQCDDPDYANLGLACDYNGTLVYGQTETYDLEQLVPELYSKGLINESGDPEGKFQNFIDECIESEYAPGSYRSESHSVAGSEGENCVNGAEIPTDSGGKIAVNKLYDYYQDLQSQKAMDEEPNSNGDGNGDSSSDDISISGSQDPKTYQDKFLSEHPDGCAVGYCTSSNGCTTIPAWFITEHTSLKYGHGNGNQVVDQLVAANPGKNLVVTNKPTKVPAIFSTNATGMNATGTTYGHTGLVTAINEDGTIQTLEAGAGMGGKMHTQTFTHKASDYATATEFVYIGDYLK